MIAADLNAKGVKTDRDRDWTPSVVRQLLSNEKYIGNNIWNRHSFKLKKRHVNNDPNTWIRSIGAFEAIVDAGLFAAAKAIFAARAQRLVDARKQFGKGRGTSDQRSRKNLSVETLLRTYQNDVEKKKILLRKAGATRSEMMSLTQSLKTLLSDDNFVTLLRAEGLSNIPKTIADRLTRMNGTKT